MSKPIQYNPRYPSIEDLRAKAKKRIPKFAFEYLDGGCNEDISLYKNTNELNSLKECLGHYMNEVHIIMEPTVMKYGSLNMGLIPWICHDNYEQCMNFIRDCKADWIGSHLELNGFEVMRGLTNKH
ncbi:MAG: hypothetical protein ACPH4K_08140, partial [Flavobacteriaceae bacterium]